MFGYLFRDDRPCKTWVVFSKGKKVIAKDLVRK